MDIHSSVYIDFFGSLPWSRFIIFVIGVSNLELRLFVVSRGGEAVLKKDYDVPSGGVRGAVHQFCNEVVKWFTGTAGGPAEKVRGMFVKLAQSARHPKWKGCGFLRTTAELANMPGHPAMKVGAAHKKKFESWMRLLFEREGVKDAIPLARQMMLLLDGSFAVTLLHRDPSYMETAGDAAYALIKAALPSSP